MPRSFHENFAQSLEATNSLILLPVEPLKDVDGEPGAGCSTFVGQGDDLLAPLLGLGFAVGVGFGEGVHAVAPIIRSTDKAIFRVMGLFHSWIAARGRLWVIERWTRT